MLSCLFSERGTDMRAQLSNLEQAKRVLASAIAAKPETHPFGSDFAVTAGAMANIGG